MSPQTSSSVIAVLPSRRRPGARDAQLGLPRRLVPALTALRWRRPPPHSPLSLHSQRRFASHWQRCRFSYPLIFGWSMLLLPITLAVFGFLQRWQARHVFRTLDIHPQPDKRGFLGYLFAYRC